MAEADVRIKVRSASGHSPTSLLPAELALRTDTNWLFYGDLSNNPELLSGQNRVSVARNTMTGNIQLDLTSARYQFCDPNGSNRDIVLPITPVLGLIFNIRNIGSEDLIIKQTTTAIATLGVTTQDNYKDGVEAVCIYDGIEWQLTIYG